MFPAHACQQLYSLTLALLVIRWFNKTLELYVDVYLDAQKESHFEEH